ncbi:MAG: chemotaxis protein CheA [Thermodesulfobacteriota bacterium]
MSDSYQDQMKAAFLEEAGDLLPALEGALLEMEESPGDAELVNKAFRSLHTIKGSGSMAGLTDISDFAHHVETVFDLIRNGELEADRQILDLGLSAKDMIENMLHDPDSVDRDHKSRIMERVQSIISSSGSASGQEVSNPAADPGKMELDDRAADEGQQVTYRIRFKPPQNLFMSGGDPLNLLQELDELGDSRVIAHTEDLPDLEDMNPESCYIWWDIILDTDQGMDAIRDVFIFVEDESELSIQVIDEENLVEDQEATYKRLGEILVERGDVSEEEINRVLSEQRPLGELLTSEGVVSEQVVQSALVEQNTVREKRSERKDKDAGSSLRVAASKLDQLVDLVGEMVIAQARLSQKVGEKEDPELTEIAEEVERLSGELRDNTLGQRMLPIGSSFGRFRRVVRDLARDKGKDVQLLTHGADTELDKTVIEKLTDPLVHLLRNSIDHGIESPETREAAGKPSQGSVSFQASQSGGNVIISIKDDGQGLDPEKLRQKGVERGLISPEDECSEKELFNLIFNPGFSTAEEVSDVSGRGVGMDVIKRNIDALQGSIDIDSKKGEGTSINLKIPLTMAILDGLLVKIGDVHFVVPLSAVDECMEISREEASKNGKRNIVDLRGEFVPYVYLREHFEMRDSPPPIEQMIISDVEGARMGFVVDHILGEQQTVIKKLGKVFSRAKEFSGATILGDGTVALILDISKLSALVEQQQQVHC